MLLSTVCADVVNTPLNHSVVFVKYKDVILTSYYWRIVVNFDLCAYEDATTILREDLFRVKEIAKRSTQFGELRQLETILASMENKLRDLRDFFT